MSFSDAAENAIMVLLFNATAWAGMADNAAAAPQTAIAVALHTADPGESGTQATNEVTYTGYGRVNVPRTGASWVVTGNSASPAANIDFPAGAGGGGTITHFSTGKTGGGTSPIHMSGAVAPNVVSGNGVTPRLTTATTLTLD